MMPTPVRDPLKISVPKKLLPRAIDRNLVRRIVREAWRAGVKASASKPGVAVDTSTVIGGADAASGAGSVAESAGPELSPSLLLRLRSKPAVFVDGGVDARRRQVRAEVDRLLRLAVVR